MSNVKKIGRLKRRNPLTILADFVDKLYVDDENRYIGNQTQTPSNPTQNVRIVGYKQLRLNYNDGKIAINSCTHGTERDLEIIEEAHCLEYRHLATIPVASCSCGFYAFKKKGDAFSYSASRSEIIAEVVISDKFLEYDKGYRYNTQRIRNFLIRNCEYCKNKPAVVLSNDLKALKPLCEGCAKNVFRTQRRTLMSFEEATSYLSTEQLEGYGYKNPEFLSTEDVEPLTREQVSGLRKNNEIKKTEYKYDWLDYVLEGSVYAIGPVILCGFMLLPMILGVFPK